MRPLNIWGIPIWIIQAAVVWDIFILHFPWIINYCVQFGFLFYFLFSRQVGNICLNCFNKLKFFICCFVFVFCAFFMCVGIEWVCVDTIHRRSSYKCVFCCVWVLLLLAQANRWKIHNSRRVRKCFDIDK